MILEDGDVTQDEIPLSNLGNTPSMDEERSRSPSISSDEEEEDECRVCRGPAEKGYVAIDVCDVNCNW